MVMITKQVFYKANLTAFLLGLFIIGNKELSSRYAHVYIEGKSTSCDNIIYWVSVNSGSSGSRANAQYKAMCLNSTTVALQDGLQIPTLFDVQRIWDTFHTKVHIKGF